MLTVTLKLKSYTGAGDNWLFNYGAASPFATYSTDWFQSGSAGLPEPITVEMGDDIRYIRVGIRTLGVPGWNYLFEMTDPIVFEDNTTYIWDCATNSLAPEAPPPVPGNFIDNIVTWLNSVADWCYVAYLEVMGWVWPFSYLQYPFYALFTAFTWLSVNFALFGDWVDAVATAVSDILSSVDIISLLQTWLTYAEDTWAWITAAVTNVGSIIANWWAEASETVQGWISVAAQGLSALLVAWDNFWTVILPGLIDVTWIGDWWQARLVYLASLIDSAFVIRDSLWAGWQEVRDNVQEFISNPFDWLLERFTDWFLGKE